MIYKNKKGPSAATHRPNMIKKTYLNHDIRLVAPSQISDKRVLPKESPTYTPNEFSKLAGHEDRFFDPFDSYCQELGGF